MLNNTYILHAFFIFITIIAPFSRAVAEHPDTYYSYALGVAEGLSSPTTFNIVKGHDGFVWIATRQGIDMYNGIAFKHYNLFPNDIRTIYDGHKISVYSGSNGTLWAYTDSGNIYYYNINSDAFELFIRTSDYAEGSLLNSLLQVGDKLYLNLTDGIRCIDIKQKSILHAGLTGVNVNTLIPYKDKTLMAGTQTGIYTVSAELHITEHYTSTPRMDIQALFWEPLNDEIWIGSSGQGVWKMKGTKLLPISAPQLSTSTIRTIQPLDDHNLLLGSDGMGVFHIHINETEPQLLAANMPGHDLQLSASSVYDIMVDGGNIWVATYQGGITLLRKNNAVRWLENRSREISSENFVHGICQDAEGKVWTAFNSSIGCFDITTNEFKNHLNRVAGFLTLAIDNEGYLWCGGYSSGVYRMNTRTGAYEHISSVDGNPENDHVYTIYKDAAGDIWIGGLNFRLTRITVDGSGYRIKQHYDIKQVRTLCAISQDRLLVGTTSGFRIVDTQSGEVASYLQTYHDVDWTGTNFINCMVRGAGNDIWFGTAGGGLVCYNLESGQLTAYTTQKGLPSNYIASMQMDDENRLWISTETCGIFAFDCNTRKFISGIKRYEGLLFNDFFPNSSCRLADGQLAFGGYNGAIVFQPSSILPPSESPGICFTTLMVGNEKATPATHPGVLDTPLGQMAKMKLPHSSRSFALDVCTSNLYNQSSYQLYYRLRGYEDEWMPLIQQHQIAYANLPPGRYTLQIRNSDADLPDAVQRDVEIVVEQTIWLQWYAFVGYLLALFCLAYWALITYKSRMDNKLSSEKIHFFTNVAHDIRTPLSLVAAPLERLNKLIDSSDRERSYLLGTAMKSIRHLQEMVSQLMEFNKSGMTNELVHCSTVDLKVQLSIINDVYLPAAEAKGLSLTVHYPPGNCYVYTDETLFHRIMDNLLSNALKYTLQGSVDIIVSVKAKHVLIEVKDTGIGISRESGNKLFRHFVRGENAINEQIAGYGIGLFFTYRLAKLLNGKLSFRSKPSSGTSFYLSLPLVKSKELAPYTSRKRINKETADVTMPVSGHSVRKQNILLVEDNAELREFLSYALSESYNVVAASSAEEALEKIPSFSTDLVITDMTMQGMNGNELCRHLKKQLETSHIPIILLTANTDKDTMSEGLAAGADDYITKPFDLDILLLKIQNLFHARKKLHAYYLSRIQIEPAEKDVQPDETKATTQESVDDMFLNKLTSLIMANLSNSEFTVKNICEEMAMSRTLLYEKIRKLLEMAPNDLIREIRMKQAKARLEKGNCSVASVAFECGYPDARYFSTAFKNYYGVSPSTIIPKNQEDRQQKEKR